MEIPAKQVYGILRDNGVKAIYHANSVITSCQFLRAGSLLSKETVERKGLYQSAQRSDQIDKKYGIWFDIFTDCVDIHLRASKANIYGPVLFIFDSEIIKNTITGGVWMTKLNPTKWEGKQRGKKWFVSKEDLEQNFARGEFDQMVVFRQCGGELPFENFLKEIILDDPDLKSRKSNIDYYSMAYGALRLAITEGRINVEIKKRQCPENCKCLEYYKSNLKKTNEMFIPKI